MDDGGKAFPVVCSTPDEVRFVPGMSLRDWFAGKALIGILSNNELGGPETSFKQNATAAYTAADAMLAERAKGTP